MSRLASPRASRASSISPPFSATRIESPRDSPSVTPRGRQSRSPSFPPQPSKTIVSGPDLHGHLLPPSPFYVACESDSLAAMVNTTANNSAREDTYYDLTSGEDSHSGGHPSLRESVDSFAFRMMAPDSSRPFRGMPLIPGNSAANSDLTNLRNSSRLSVLDIVGDRTDDKLQKVDPFFNDSTGEYYRDFEQKLRGLSAKNSEGELWRRGWCAGEYVALPRLYHPGYPAAICCWAVVLGIHHQCSERHGGHQRKRGQ